jgi:peptidoglycan/xylan/chitin deacetylase (PgdA/CDA1 family)
MSSQLLVVAWHNIESTWHYPAPAGAGTRGFERQVSWLNRIGTVVPLGDAIASLRAGRPLPPLAIALTFDDGYVDNLELAVPILRRFGLPATFFLVPDLLDGKASAWWELLGWGFAHAGRASVEWRGAEFPTGGPAGARSLAVVAESLKHLDRLERDAVVAELLERLEPEGEPDVGRLFMDGDQAAQLVGAGMQVGSHSMHHAILGRETPEAQRVDLVQSRSWLERALDVPIDVLAYPNGRWADFDQHTVAAAEAAGYLASCTTQAGRNRPDVPAHAVRRVVFEPHRGFTGMALQRVRGRLGGSSQVPPSAGT